MELMEDRLLSAAGIINYMFTLFFQVHILLFDALFCKFVMNPS